MNEKSITVVQTGESQSSRGIIYFCIDGLSEVKMYIMLNLPCEVSEYK